MGPKGFWTKLGCSCSFSPSAPQKSREMWWWAGEALPFCSWPRLRQKDTFGLIVTLVVTHIFSGHYLCCHVLIFTLLIDFGGKWRIEKNHLSNKPPKTLLLTLLTPMKWRNHHSAFPSVSSWHYAVLPQATSFGSISSPNVKSGLSVAIAEQAVVHSEFAYIRLQKSLAVYFSLLAIQLYVRELPWIMSQAHA
jgi:hypothetical protein